MNTQLIVDGIAYKSIKDCCNDLGLHYDSVLKLKRKYTELPPEKLLRMLKHSTFHEYIERSIVVRGVRYKSIRECALALGIDAEVLIDYKRYNTNLTYEEVAIMLFNRR